TLIPHPYFGPVTPRTSRRTHRMRTSSSTSTVTVSPLSWKVCFGIAGRLSVVSQYVWSRPSTGDAGTGGTNDLGSKWSGSRKLIGNSVGRVPVARAYAQATAAIDAATPASPTP